MRARSIAKVGGGEGVRASRRRGCNVKGDGPSERKRKQVRAW